MDEARWQALIRKIEPAARNDPAKHRRKVFLLALLGYAFIAGFVAFFLAIAAGIIVAALHSSVLVLKFLIPVGALLVVVARSLYVTFDPPTGVRVSKQNAPELFRMLDEVTHAIRGPRLHTVLVDERANAGIVQVPRVGGIFGSRNYLVLGLPYLLGLTAEEFRAVVGHELGHLSRRHGRFGAFVYRIHQTWVQLLEAFEERRSMWTGVIRLFFEWYVPYFSAYTFPIMRAHEFEADDAAAQVAGSEPAASGMVSGLLAARWLEEAYWPQLYSRADELPNPPETAFASLAQRIGEAPSYGNVEATFKALVEEETDLDSTHPSLGERLAHLGVDPQSALAAAVAPGRVPAAESYLGDRAAQLVAAVDDRWATAIQPLWREARGEALRARRRLEYLNGLSERSPDAELERASLTERFDGDEAALELYRGLLDGEHDGAARFAIGRILLEQGNDDGLGWLRRAMDSDPDVSIPACVVALGYLAERGREDEEKLFQERFDRDLAIFEAAAEEREGVTVDDELVPAELPPQAMGRVVQRVRSRKEIVAAYLVCKTVEHRADRPFFVLAWVAKDGVRASGREEESDEAIDDWLSRMVDVPGELMVARVLEETPIGRHIAAVDGALLFRRE